MAEPRNKRQPVADAVVRAMKERRRLVGIAVKGLEAPAKLSAEDIETVCRFVVAHAECLEPSKF